jgi:thymidylate synthase
MPLWFPTLQELSSDESKLYEQKTNADTCSFVLSEIFTTFNRTSLMWNQRSVDTALGLPFNITSYALLLEFIGKVLWFE